MTLFRKRIMLVVFAFVFAIATVAGLNLAVTHADPAPKTVDEIEFNMIDGASVRLKTGSNGMRFVGAISKADYEGLTAYYDEVEYGMFIMPKTYLALGEINYYNTFGGGRFDVNADYGEGIKIGSGATAKYKIIHMLSMATESDDSEDIYWVRGSIVNVLDQNLARDFTACAYIKASKDGEDFYKFAESMTVTRSMLEVSYRVLNSGIYDEDVAKKEILEAYETTYMTVNDIDPEDKPEFHYTINYIIKSTGTEVYDSVSADYAMNTPFDIQPSIPRGYILDAANTKCLDGSGHLKGIIVASDLTYTIYVKAKQIKNIESLCVEGVVGVLGADCNKSTQYIELPEELRTAIGGVSYLDTALIVDAGYDLSIPASAYDSATGKLSFSSETVTTRINTLTTGRGTYDCKIEGNNAVYTSKIDIYGYNHPLRVIETADEFQGNFTTRFFDNAAKGGSEWTYYSYVIAADIDMTGKTISSGDYATYSTNAYTGTIDGRGHVVSNLTFNSNEYASYGGLIEYKAAYGAVVKNIALVNMSTPRAFITNKADGLVIKNVYISGTSGWGEVFDEAANTNGKVKVDNVIIGSSAALYDAANYSAYATVNNVINVGALDGGEAEFFTTYAAGLPSAWDDSGFAVNSGALKYCGTTIISATITELEKSSDIRSKYNPKGSANYVLTDDIVDGTIYYNSWGDAFSGVLDGNGHVLKDMKIDDDVTSYGLLAEDVNGAVVKDIAIVNLTGSSRNLISYGTADGSFGGLIIKNAYISGTTYYHDLFEYVLGGDIILENVILDCYCTRDNYMLGKAGAFGASKVTYTNVIQLNGTGAGTYNGSTYTDATIKTYDEFFALEEPSWFEEAGFTLADNVLYFHGKPILSKDFSIKWLSSEDDLNAKFLTNSDEIYELKADINCTTDASITYSSTSFSGTLNGNGHFINNPVIDDNISSYGMLGVTAKGATVKDIAVVNLTNSYRNYFSYYADGVTIQNSYFSGVCGWHDLFEEVTSTDSSKVTLKNVILDCYCSDGYALGKAGTSGAANVVYDNVITLDKNNKGAHSGSEYGVTLMTYEEFFTTYAAGLPSAWDDTGFVVEDNALKFNGTVLIKNISPLCQDNVLGYVERQGDDEQTLTLPYSLGEITEFKLNGSSVSGDYYSHTADTNVITIAKSAFSGLTLATEINCSFKSDGVIYFAKVYYTDYVLRTAKDIYTKFSQTQWYDDTDNGGSAYSYYNFAFANDIDCSKTSYGIAYDTDYSASNFYSGTIDGRGHVLKDAVVSSVWFGMINYKIGNGAVIKDLAIVDVHNGHNNLIASIADGVTLTNVYISGTTPSGYLFGAVNSGKATLENVIINFNNGDGLIAEDTDNIVRDNVIIVDEDFNENYDEEDWAGSGFTLVGNELTFNGKTVCKITVPAVKFARGVSSAKANDTESEPEGLKVTLAAGDTFKYNVPVDLTGKTKTDTLISFYVVPETAGIADVADVKVRFTDVYDPDNYIEAVVYANPFDENEFEGRALYCGARSSIQDNYVGAGYHDWSNVGVEDDIYTDIVYYTEGGYWSFKVSLAVPGGYASLSPFTFSMDYANKKLYGYDQHDSYDSYISHLIADFDDSDFVGDDIWDGFTTGEVYISIYSDFYVKTSFTFVITELIGVDNVAAL